MKMTIDLNSPLDPLIIVDERERGQIRSVFADFPVRTQIETLFTGDYILSDSIAIERKRGDDLVASICDNRFFRQLLTIKKYYAEPMVILENPARMFMGRGVNTASIYGAMVYACMRLNIPIIPTKTEHETGQILWSLAKKIQADRPYEYHPLTVGIQPLTKQDQLMFLEGLTDVGESKAEELLAVFHTPWGVLQAIQESQISFSSVGKPKGVTGPLSELSGYGPKFLQKNQELLTMIITESENQKCAKKKIENEIYVRP
jgi:ERCC4-type nuclease